MLSELFVTATLSPAKPAVSNAQKDSTVAVHALHPSPSVKATFKKSSCPPNCLAVSETHVFAAQADKALVHVYSRERGALEATVPFPERIHSLTLAAAGAGGIVILGTEGGRVILWETCTGRQLSTSRSHLQATTALATDLTSNFLLSGSADSNIYLWSLPALVSFSNPSSDSDLSATSGPEPLQSLTHHRAAITCARFGHGSGIANIAVTASQDGSCIVWDIQSGTALRTFLLTSSPISLAVDPCDRSFYVGFKDGSIQCVDLFKAFSQPRKHNANGWEPSGNTDTEHPGPLLPSNHLYVAELQNTPVMLSSNSDHWVSTGQELGATLCLDIMYEGNYILSGHENGKVYTWDVAKGRVWKEIIDLQSPVTNLIVLPPSGFAVPNATSSSTIKVTTVTKPRYDASFTTAGGGVNGAVPTNYTFTAQFTETLTTPHISAIYPASSQIQDEQTLLSSCITTPSFHPSVLAASIAELASWAPGQSTKLGVSGSNRSESELERENKELTELVQSLRKVQKDTWEVVLKWGKERGEARAARNAALRSRKGDYGSDEEIEGDGADRVGMVGADYGSELEGDGGTS